MLCNNQPKYFVIYTRLLDKVAVGCDSDGSVASVRMGLVKRLFIFLYWGVEPILISRIGRIFRTSDSSYQTAGQYGEEKC